MFGPHNARVLLQYRVVVEQGDRPVRGQPAQSLLGETRPLPSPVGYRRIQVPMQQVVVHEDVPHLPGEGQSVLRSGPCRET